MAISDLSSGLVEFVKRRKKTSIILALAAALILFFILKPSTPTYEYVSEVVGKGEVVSKVTASGKLRALNTIKVGAEVSGQITNVYVDFNSPVRAGQVLAEIDPTRFRARVQQVQAQVSLAQAALLQAEANATRASTDLTIQQREFGRRQNLEAGGFVSKAGLDGAASSLAAARAAVKTTNAQIASARAQISQATAEMASAQLDLRRTKIIAPSGGVIINKLVEPGTTVAASFQTPNLFEIAADTTQMQVEASVDEADIGQIKTDQEVRFTVDAYPDQAFKASVRQIRKAATETQNVVTYLVILDVPNLDGKLLPGMTANVEIVTGEKANVLRVPTAALRFRPRKADREEDDKVPNPKQVTVYVVGTDPYRPQRRVIETGLIGEDHAEITKGVKAGEKVVLRAKSTVVPDGIEPDNDEGEGGGHPTT
jgi:HlyD family secretion protein